MKALKFFRSSLLIVTSVISISTYAQLSVNVRIDVAPPPIPVYEQPMCPSEGYVWVPGYWKYDDYNNEYYWVDGRWVRPARIGWFWTPGYWAANAGYYTWHRGYWGPTVGYYGGVCYGYGYYGDGFCGGRWKGNRFYYNTAAWRVNNASMHYTYVGRSRVIERGRGNNHSYYGPRSGRNEGGGHSERIIGKHQNHSGSPEHIFRNNPKRNDVGRHQGNFGQGNHAGAPRGGRSGGDGHRGGGGRHGH